MNKTAIQAVSQKEFGQIPIAIERKTIGICNEVYELKLASKSVILRMNQQKEWLYGTHKFLPLFKKLNITTPDIIAEDYSKTTFPFCYQIQTKLAGKDLGVVIDTLTPTELKAVAKSVSDIFDKFNTLPPTKDFGGLTGLNEEHFDHLNIGNHRTKILERNKTSNVISPEILRIYDEVLETYQGYFEQVTPRLYYGDICSKNVMVHQGQFTGLVDLDFLAKGDYLEAIGRMIAVWYGTPYGEIYIHEISKLQNLTEFQQKIINVYGILTLVLWTSEEGIRFNGNSSGAVNWERVEAKRQKILGLYDLI